ncbi:COQ9 family protein [Sphingomonas sp. ID0503]|uniref:COQ9 family protein n=1 Tax=Sphingomonas sp. ID0503 TaxID=3399691 RepID=UPI003AFB1132
MIGTQDLTLDEMRAKLAPVVPAHAAFDGWTAFALDRAAEEAGIAPMHAALALPKPIDMIDAWFGWIDGELARRLTPEALGAMKVRARITTLVATRTEIAGRHKDALARALPILGLNPARAAKLGWRAADGMWRMAGDTATDLNHYTKRTTLAGVYAATILAFLDYEGEGEGDGWRAFLDRRIEDVMRFEKVKAQWRPQPDNHFNIARFLGRLRYPAR